MHAPALSIRRHIGALTLIWGLVLRPWVAHGQVNPLLKRELDSIYVTDQLYREYLSSMGDNPKLQDSLSAAFNVPRDELVWYLWAKQNKIDSLNLRRVAAIIKQHGYPGKTLVGTPTQEAAWYVIQHSPAIETYFPLIKKAGQQKELPFSLVAMMHDRLRTQQNKLQRYGTQVLCYPPKKQPDHAECFVWPIAHPRRVNKRRRKAGFPDTVEENASRLGVAYQVLSKAQVQQRYQTPPP